MVINRVTCVFLGPHRSFCLELLPTCQVPLLRQGSAQYFLLQKATDISCKQQDHTVLCFGL